MSMNKIFDKLKHIDIERGKSLQGFAASIEIFKKDGRLGEPTSVRKKLKLPEPPKTRAEDLKKLLLILQGE